MLLRRFVRSNASVPRGLAADLDDEAAGRLRLDAPAAQLGAQRLAVELFPAARKGAPRRA